MSALLRRSSFQLIQNQHRPRTGQQRRYVCGKCHMAYERQPWRADEATHYIGDTVSASNSVCDHVLAVHRLTWAAEANLHGREYHHCRPHHATLHGLAAGSSAAVRQYSIRRLGQAKEQAIELHQCLHARIHHYQQHYWALVWDGVSNARCHKTSISQLQTSFGRHSRRRSRNGTAIAFCEFHSSFKKQTALFISPHLRTIPSASR